MPFSQSKLGVKNVPVYDTKFMLVMNFSIFIKVEWLVLAKTRISKGVLLMPVSSRSFQLTHWSCKKRRGADVFSEIIDESILVESLNLRLRDPSTCDQAGSHSRDPYPIHAALRLTTRWEIRPKRSFRIFQGVLSKLRCSELLLFLPSKTNVTSNHRCLKQAFSYLHFH